MSNMQALYEQLVERAARGEQIDLSRLKTVLRSAGKTEAMFNAAVRVERHLMQGNVTRRNEIFNATYH